ncbi:penicillin-binding protein 1A [Pseudomonas oryzihabitans]|uniref:penicillin-binding protein 1A n=1 Tax=Pseudomonas oryzihabitans TaxID=47885 RepID=UPI002895D6F3|nr:penicillin-binding protein 1A [Pseudomonas oryzihabitans]MDT3719195.1 penicillin-binding protein 1A [Pseudomonas oryzihabitans]
MRVLKFFWWSLVALVCSLLLGLSGAFLYLSPSLPSIDALRNVQLQIPLRVYSADGKLIAEFGEMRRSPLRFSEIPPDFIHALLSAEDDNFANHYGVDVKSLMRAVSQLVKTGHIQTGGSTITMQVAKNYFLTSERSFSRKFTEILLALQIERQLTKDEILELYVNKIYLGNRAYGIEAAAQVYYGKSIKDLTVAQMAMIAGLPKAPSRYNPVANPERSLERRNWILERMFKLGYIDQAAYQAGIAEPLEAYHHVAVPELNAPYIAEMARAEMVGRYGGDAYTDGYQVYTTIDSRLQTSAFEAVRDGLTDYDRRHGYRGPEAQWPNQSRAEWAALIQKQRIVGGQDPAVVTQVEKSGILVMTREGKEEAVSWESMKWARPYLSANSLGPRPNGPADVVKVGDLVRVQRQDDGSLKFSQIPKAQSALVSLDPQDGAIRALIGGFSFEQSNYNRATQARRQPGSSFKPFIYSAALEKGFTAASLVNDAPIVFMDENPDEVWRPKNDNNTFLGPIRLREALYRSRNLVSIRVLQAIGIDYALDYVSRFGFERDQLPRNLSLALGTPGLTPLEVATGWSVFANEGYKVTPYVVDHVTDRDGKVVYRAAPPRVPQQPQAQAAAGVQVTPATDTATADPANPAQVFAPQVIDPRNAYIMNSMLQDVIKRGTGRKALELGRNDLAGKTGTTNESKDTWFSGYNGDYVTTVWAGFDQPDTLGRQEFGGTVALPIWMSYMGAALKDKPEHQLKEPDGIVSIRVDPTTGRAAPPGTPNAYFELFKSEDTPPSLDELPPGVAPGTPLPSSETVPMDIF